MIHSEPHNFTVDNWAMGILLYEMIVGEAPWGKSQWEITKRIGDVDLKIPETVPASASDLIRRLLLRRPDDRLPLMEALRHPWVKASAPSFQLESISAVHQARARAGSTGACLHGELSPSPQSLAPCTSLPFGLKPEATQNPLQAANTWEPTPLQSPLAPDTQEEPADVRLGYLTPPRSGSTPFGSSSQRGVVASRSPGAQAFEATLAEPLAGSSLETDARCGSLLHRLELDETEEGDAWRRRLATREREVGPMSPLVMRDPSVISRSPQSSVASSCAQSCASRNSDSAAKTWKETTTYNAICDFVRRGPTARRASKDIESTDTGQSPCSEGLATLPRATNAAEAGGGLPGSAAGPTALADLTSKGIGDRPQKLVSELSIKVSRSRDPDECISPLTGTRPWGQDDCPPISADATVGPLQAASIPLVCLNTSDMHNGDRYDVSPTRLSDIRGLGDTMMNIRARIEDDLDNMKETLTGRLGQCAGTG
jgi:hypothetical protein